ncbi:coat protein [Botrytis cinerea partitivirus 3]|nr:coat protein [Botrytis cinerea partitivirus 3]
MSTVTPSESASSSGKKKRPGKMQRQQAKGLPGGQPAQTAPSSVSAASRFSSAVPSMPTPQPGKFPVVFPSGAGEPTRDAFFAYSGGNLGRIAQGLPERYESNSKFAEFSAHTELSSGDFETEITSAFFLGLAQQTVHAHVNMGLPQGDFSPVFSSDVTNFAAVRSILAHFGEFSSDTLGSRYLLAGYAETVKALVRAAASASSSTPDRIGSTFWLPTSADCKNSRFIVASALASFLSPSGVSLDVERLAESVFHGSSDVWEGIKPLLGDPPNGEEPDPRDRFDFLFARYSTPAAFLTAVGDPSRSRILGEIGLEWPTPADPDLSWSLNVKEVFSSMTDQLARKRATYAKFFSCGSGVANRSQAIGSSIQISSTASVSGVTIVKSLLAQAAPEYSLLACFPLSGVFGPIKLNVVLTTSLNVSQRATEFTQLDWL